MASRILVTGGAGYIGSHTVLELLQRGDEVVVIDNLVNAHPAALQRVADLTGRQARLVEADLCDLDAVRALFADTGFEAVIHFAGLKAVGESVALPLDYYHNNITGTLNLLRVMQEVACKRLIFSSSATVYGDPHAVPITEDFPLQATNPYGRTKLFIEEILRDWCQADDTRQVILLRYFNPVGAHASGRIGEDPNGRPNNLMPFIAQVAVGRQDELQIFGDDYDTVDGTGVRDYIHVVDLALGHLAALDHLHEVEGCRAVNLGTGSGYSVLQMVQAFSAACGREIPYRIVDRRPGDVAQCYADPTAAAEFLGWRAVLDLQAMCADTWRWQAANPQGYAAIAAS